MQAVATCPHCEETFERGGRDRADAKESAAFPLRDHLKTEHGETVSLDEVMAKFVEITD